MSFTILPTVILPIASSLLGDGGLPSETARWRLNETTGRGVHAEPTGNGYWDGVVFGYEFHGRPPTVPGVEGVAPVFGSGFGASLGVTFDSWSDPDTLISYTYRPFASQEWSMSFWMNADLSSGLRVAVDLGHFGLEYEAWAGGHHFERAVGYTRRFGVSVVPSWLAEPVTAGPSPWDLIVVTQSGPDGELVSYRNGQRDAVWSTDPNWALEGPPVLTSIGYGLERSGGSAMCMDDVRLWDGVTLTDDHVASLYAATRP